MDPQVREKRLSEVRIFRCRGPAGWVACHVPYLPTFIVREGANVLLDAEGRAVGWAQYSIKRFDTGIEVWADAIIDHECEARLLAENGELGLAMYVVIEGSDDDPPGRRVIVKRPSTIAWVPAAHTLNLKPVEASWQDLFISEKP
jgi:hypothetical protein